MAFSINKCPLCGGIVNIQANANVRIALYDNGRTNYELLTSAEDVLNQVRGVIRDPIIPYDDYNCFCTNCGAHDLRAEEQSSGRFRISLSCPSCQGHNIRKIIGIEREQKDSEETGRVRSVIRSLVCHDCGHVQEFEYSIPDSNWYYPASM